MKSISIAQPWASLIAMGAKTILTYPYPTTYFGTLIIYADNNEIIIEDSYLLSVLTAGGYKLNSLPRCVAVAKCKLIACEKIKTETIPCYPEYAFSEFREGWYLWKLSEIEAMVDAKVQSQNQDWRDENFIA